VREALRLGPADPLPAQLSSAWEAIERCTDLGADKLIKLNVGTLRREINALLLRTSEQVRSMTGRLGPKLRGADLTGADLRGADLTGARLDTAIFLTQVQIDLAKGDAATTLPASLARPGRTTPSPASNTPRAHPGVIRSPS
jgi:hypothetical protein